MVEEAAKRFLLLFLLLLLHPPVHCVAYRLISMDVGASPSAGPAMPLL